jgi:hypothetical protein
MNTIHSSNIALFDTPVSRSLVPARPVAEANEAGKRPLLPPAPTIAISDEQQQRLEARADRFMRQVEPESETSSRNRQAIQAYQSLVEVNEREQVSLLLGVDEYA